jgi:ribosome-binding factor A
VSRRTVRVGAQLMEEIARLLREEVTDPRIRLVTLTRIDVSPDLRNAIVFYSALDPDGEPDVESLAAGLESAAPFLRRRAARVLPLKRMPELHFRFDPSLALGSKTLDVLREIAREPSSASPEASASEEGTGE